MPAEGIQRTPLLQPLLEPARFYLWAAIAAAPPVWRAAKLAVVCGRRLARSHGARPWAWNPFLYYRIPHAGSQAGPPSEFWPALLPDFGNFCIGPAGEITRRPGQYSCIFDAVPLPAPISCFPREPPIFHAAPASRTGLSRCAGTALFPRCSLRHLRVGRVLPVSVPDSVYKTIASVRPARRGCRSSATKRRRPAATTPPPVRRSPRSRARGRLPPTAARPAPP